MAKSNKKKLTTNEALEQLLGKKAAKRIRRVAKQVAAVDGKAKKRLKTQITG
jgi:hypothetical protein